MNSKNILIPAFIIVALMQLYVPAKMIWDRENILATGTIYKFKTAPIDPNDPFRGKYITLNFEENTFEVDNEADWTSGETIFLIFTTDERGFAIIKAVSKEKPLDHEDFLETKVAIVSANGSHELTFYYPFDRFYMEESKAYDAELTYRESQADTNKTTYALVSIKEGGAVLKDVLIDGRPIGELVNQ